jgi:hypothetical protein
MGEKTKEVVRKDENSDSKEGPRCLEVSKRGVQTGSDFAEMMSGLMSDLVEGRVTPQVGNAVCNAGGKLLKIVEMNHKYGTTDPSTPADHSLKLIT